MYFTRMATGNVSWLWWQCGRQPFNTTVNGSILLQELCCFLYPYPIYLCSSKIQIYSVTMIKKTEKSRSLHLKARIRDWLHFLLENGGSLNNSAIIKTLQLTQLSNQ